MGNQFLKNFYSVYDFDQQSVMLGVNINAENLARIRKFHKHKWATEKS